MSDTGGEPSQAEYTAWLAKIEAQGTPPLHEFEKWWDHDPNLVWRIGIGHLVNLLEVALDEIEDLTNEVQGYQRDGLYEKGWEHATAAWAGEISRWHDRFVAQEDTGTTGVSENPGDTPFR